MIIQQSINRFIYHVKDEKGERNDNISRVVDSTSNQHKSNKKENTGVSTWINKKAHTTWSQYRKKQGIFSCVLRQSLNDIISTTFYQQSKIFSWFVIVRMRYRRSNNKTFQKKKVSIHMAILVTR